MRIVGRKRRSAPRRSGRIDWRLEREDPAVTTKWHRARDAFLNGIGGDRRMASQAGRMFARRSLTAIEIEAIDRWCEMLEVYDREVLNRSRTVRPAGLERSGATLRPDNADRMQRFREKFDAAEKAMIAQAGKEALTALNRLCRDEAASSVMEEAKRAIAVLVLHFRL